MCLVPSSSGEAYKATIGTLRRPSVLSLLKLISFSPKYKTFPSPQPNSTRRSRAPRPLPRQTRPTPTCQPDRPCPRAHTPSPRARTPSLAPHQYARQILVFAHDPTHPRLRAVHQYAPYTSTRRTPVRALTPDSVRSHTHDPTRTIPHQYARSLPSPRSSTPCAPPVPHTASSLLLTPTLRSPPYSYLTLVSSTPFVYLTRQP